MNYVRGQLQQAPLQPQAEQMAQYGRYGDSMLVHMNPAEVQGIASLTPGGLTTNPVTGQPEAFAFLIPMLASMAAPGAFTAAAGALGTGALGSTLAAIGANSALAGAIGSGLATTAMTGDLKKGIASGLMGYGVGSALGAGSDAATGATETAAALGEATTAATDATKALALQTAKEGTASSALQSTADAATSAADELSRDLFTQRTGLIQGTGENFAGLNLDPSAANATTFAERFAQPFSSGDALKATAKGLAKPGAILPIAAGSGMRGDIEMQEGYERMAREAERERQAESDRAYELLGTSLSQVGQDYNMDVSGANRRYSAYDGYNMGGIVSVNPQEYQRQLGEVQRLGQAPVRMDMGGPTGGFNQNVNIPNVRFGYGPASSRQAGLRGEVAKSAEELAEVGYRPGFGPEISYFRKRLPEDDATTTDTTTPPVDAPSDPGMRDGIGSMMSESEYDALVALATTPRRGMSRASKKYQAAVQEYEDLGLTGDKQKDMGVFQTPVNMDELAFDYTKTYAMQEGGSVPSADPLIEQTMMAVLGQLSEDEAEIVIKRFVDEYGSEAFQMLREQVLQGVQPNSQTEGLIKGEGRGMDDMIPGTIGAQQPVAVSPGEYIIPADVVSAAGDGDTDAGARRFDQMLDEVRMQKTGTTKQPDPLVSSAGGLIPA
jgi:hypothetical protein